LQFPLSNLRARLKQLNSRGRSQATGAAIPEIIRVDDPNRLWSELKPFLLQVEEVNFAGGEPLLSEEHYRILDYWLENEHTEVQILYTTNFSALQFQGKRAFHYWKRFKNVEVRASLDASGKRGEYLRKGTQWIQIVKNRREMMAACPQAHFVITPTISVFSVWDFPDFHLDWIKEGLVSPNGLYVNILTYPPELSIQSLPTSLKERIVDKYQRAMASILSLSGESSHPCDQVVRGYSAVIDFINAKDTSHERGAFLAVTSDLDRIRRESYQDIFPELSLSADE
jgi:hypothetical protein